MRSSLPQAGKGSGRGAVCGVAGVMLVVASVAAAQEQPDPFRFLRPWLEPQDRGSEAPPSVAPLRAASPPAPGSGTSEPARVPTPEGGEAAAGPTRTNPPRSAAAPTPQAPS